MLLLIVLLILIFCLGGGWYGYGHYSGAPLPGGGLVGVLVLILLVMPVVMLVRGASVGF